MEYYNSEIKDIKLARHWRDWEMCTKENHVQSPGEMRNSQERDPVSVVT